MGVELGEIFRRYGDEYREKYAAGLLPSHRQAMRAIERCRTAELGGQVYECEHCGEMSYRYHSCRNRHCPKCQHEQTEKWLEVQRALLLPVPYFMLTFTLPGELRDLARENQKVIYGLLFRATAQAVQKLARDPRFVGGKIGLVGVMHTWTRNLYYHPHVHYLAPGGGLSRDKKTWLPARRDFFLPVKALSKLFRAAFQRGLRKTPLYERVPAQVWRQAWVVHCKGVGNGQAALKYLAPYIHRVAISNRRLVAHEDRGSMEASGITFRYRASDTGQIRTCTLSAEQFMQRFLQHVLPKGFVKVRYYGFFGAGVRDQLASLQQLLEPCAGEGEPDAETETAALDEVVCPQCGKPMRRLRTLAPVLCRSP
jgi:hypothetical protein